MPNFDPQVVDLSAGAGAENPPCPACGEPLFGWAKIRPKGAAVLRCELCGMAVVGGPATPDEARAALDQVAAEGATANRNSLQAWLGSSGWAGLNRESRFLFTADAVERLGHHPGRARPAVLEMWQTLVNSFSFGHNIAMEALGRGPATRAPQPWQRAIDLVILVATFVPLIVLAILFELLASITGHGGRLPLDR